MDNLRWILLLLGVVLVGVIYTIGRSRAQTRQSLLDAARDFDITVDPPPPDEEVSEIASGDDIAEQLAQFNELLVESPTGRSRIGPAEPVTPTEATAPTPAPALEQIIALHVVAPRGEHFPGDDLAAIFERRGYVFGEHQIYHSVHEERTVFSIANLVKPGRFDPAAMGGFQTPGISLFLQLPGPLAATVALDVLFAEARALADALGGIIEDQQHSTLTQQTVQHMREQVQQFSHREAAARKRR